MTLHDLKRWRESSLQRRVQVPLPRALFLSRLRLQRGSFLRTLQPCAQRLLRLTAAWAPPAPAWGFLSSCLHCNAAASKVRHFLQPIFSESVETKYSQLALYFRRWQPLQLHRS